MSSSSRDGDSKGVNELVCLRRIGASVHSRNSEITARPSHHQDCRQADTLDFWTAALFAAEGDGGTRRLFGGSFSSGNTIIIIIITKNVCIYSEEASQIWKHQYYYLKIINYYAFILRKLLV